MQRMAERFEDDMRGTLDSPASIYDRLLREAAYAAFVTKEPPEAFDRRYAAGAAAAGRRMGLSAEETGLLLAFGEGLGRTDLEGQLRHCARYRHLFGACSEKAGRAYQTKGRLARSLLSLASAAAVIVLI